MSNEIPNFNLLAVFAAVMEHGSLSKAAEHLNTNQSTISTSLNRLKKEVGQELFVRSGRGVVPTSYSTQLFTQIQSPINELNGVFRSLGNFDPQTSERRFVMTAPEHMQWALLDRFSKLTNQGLTLEVFDQPNTEDEMYDALLTQKYDAMIDIFPPKQANVASKNLFDGEFAIVCRQQHPRIQGEITEQEFLAESHAALKRTRKQLLSLQHYTDIDLSKRKIAYHGSSLFSNLLFCSQSDYLTVVPLSLAKQFAQHLGLQVFEPPFNYRPSSNYLIWLKKFEHDPAHIWLREQIKSIALEMVE